ncbi:MAG: EAL domain-containing protein [Sulfurimonadaceae bacterium]|nr:EAL domain-containing protein [Sulfurimonadaceae bacterium]
MNIIHISKQKIFDNKNQLFAYELVFKDQEENEMGLACSVKGTSKLIISSITSKELDKFLLPRTLAFINVDADVLLRGILDVLDKDRFVLNILDTITLDDKVVAKIIQYRKRGFRLCIESFDSSSEMIIKFRRLFNFIDIIKMDVVLSEPENMKKVMAKFKDSRVKLLAQNIETKEDYINYQEMGFDYFQGYYLNRPEIIELIGSKEPAQIIILQLVKIIKDEYSTQALERFIKQQPDLSYKLIQFLNNTKKFQVVITSLTQVITLMGRDTLLRWLLIYLYSEASKNAASKTILQLALKRAERMEAEASLENKDKAYLAGMFSMLGSIFETDIKELMEHIKMDKDITSLVLEKKGIFAESLDRAEKMEKEYLKKVMIDNFEKLNTQEIIYTLEDGGVSIDNEKF